MVRCTYRFILIGLLFALLSSTLRAQSVGSEQAYDVVILNGRVVNGTGNSWFYGDVAIRGDRVARITPAGLLRGAPARERIEAPGLVVAPGFIDIQSHSRGAFLTGDGRVISKVTQVITTETTGEGWTNASGSRFRPQPSPSTITIPTQENPGQDGVYADRGPEDLSRRGVPLVHPAPRCAAKDCSSP